MALPQPKKPQSRTIKKHKKLTTVSQQLPKPNRNVAVVSQSSSTGLSWMLFAVLLIVVICAWVYRSDLAQFLKNPVVETGKDIVNEHTLFIGKELVLTGEIEKNTTKNAAYTHFLHTQDYGIVGLRSTSLNMYDITAGTVQVEGKVSDFSHNKYVIEVIAIQPLTQEGSDV